MTRISAKYLGGPAHDTTYDGPYEAKTIVPATTKSSVSEYHRTQHTYGLHEWRDLHRLGYLQSTYTYWYEGPWTASTIAAFLYARAIEGNLPLPIIRELSRELIELRASRQWTEYPGGSNAERYLAKVRASEELAVGLVRPEDVSVYAHPQQGETWLRRAAAHLADHPDYQEAWRP